MLGNTSHYSTPVRHMASHRQANSLYQRSTDHSIVFALAAVDDPVNLPHTRQAHPRPGRRSPVRTWLLISHAHLFPVPELAPPTCSGHAFASCILHLARVPLSRVDVHSGEDLRSFSTEMQSSGCRLLLRSDGHADSGCVQRANHLEDLGLGFLFYAWHLVSR